ncbi:MAG: hypothetical protein JXR37_05760 [Kiritimatiellae bacterium]|nr:hypothetical protein [Kiritimatiellia bacterium]
MNEFEQLASDYLDGELSADRTAELAALLQTDEQKRAEFFGLYRQHRELAVEFGGFDRGLFVGEVLKRLRTDRDRFVTAVTEQVGEVAAKAEALKREKIIRRKRGRLIRLPHAEREGGRSDVPLRPRRRPPWGLTALAAALLVAVGIQFHRRPGPGPARAAAPAVAELREVRGAVQIVRDGAGVRARAGDAVLAGDTVRTAAADSGATVVFRAGRSEPGEKSVAPDVRATGPDAVIVAELRMDAGTALTVYRAAPASPSDAARPAMPRTTVSNGGVEVRVVSVPRAPELVLETPHLDVYVLGTEFRVSVDAVCSFVHMRQGKVRVVDRREGTSTVLAAGESLGFGTGYATSFDTPESARGWRAIRGQWAIQDGQYVHTRPTDDGNYAYAASPFRMRDGTLEARATATKHNEINKGGCFGFLKYMDKDNWYAVRFGSYGSLAVLVYEGGKQRVIETGVMWRPEVGRAYLAKVVVDGDRLMISLDDKPMAVVQDVPLFGQAGAVGFYGLSSCAFDDFRVSANLRVAETRAR